MVLTDSDLYIFLYYCYFYFDDLLMDILNTGRLGVKLVFFCPKKDIRYFKEFSVPIRKNKNPVDSLKRDCQYISIFSKKISGPQRGGTMRICSFEPVYNS